MKKQLSVLCLATLGALSAQADSFVDHARVISAAPQYESVTVPRQECRSQWVNEVRRTEAGRDYGGAILGGVAGAVIGNQVGKGHGREAATAVGAVVGAFAGDNISQRGREQRFEEQPREVTTCHMVNDVQSRITGYRVHYDWRGQSYTTFMRDNPGPTLRVRVSVDPV